MKSPCTIRKRLHLGAHGLRLGFGLSLFLSTLVHVQAAQRQWGGETITASGGAEYQSPKFGEVWMMGDPATSNLAWVPGLASFLEASGNGVWNSPEYGEIQRGNDNAGWMVSSRFGWTHFAPNAETYGSWTWSERFKWMKFERPGSSVYLWVPMMNSWMSVNPDGNFYSFEWRALTPQGLNRYQSSVFGGLTTGDFGGWVHSDVFGWMWANGDGTWFWSEGLKEWLGVTPDGGIWSTSEQRFISLTDLPKSAPEVFVRIPAGSFTMGDTVDGDEWGDAPPVNVFVSEFYVAHHEVTWALWNEVRDWAITRGYPDIAEGEGKGAKHPVHSVTWWDVVMWCNARSEKEGLTPVYRNEDSTVFKTGTTAPTADWTANGYRLPTEAEWEKAAHGGVSGQRFPWGDTITHSQANYYSKSDYSYDISPTRDFHPSYNDGTEPYTSPVGSFAANGYGLYDMAGNVYEWCWDRYSMDAYTQDASDPRGGGGSTGEDRVIRGGGWDAFPADSRSANRLWTEPYFQISTLGFRLVRKTAP